MPSLSFKTQFAGPSPSSIAHRQRIARLLEPLRSVRPHVPFYLLAAHRRPTLWALYRGLLKYSPNEDVRWRIGKVFRQYRHLTSPRQTKEQLEKGYRWLDVFTRARDGDGHLQSVLERYGRLIAAKRDKVEWTGILLAEKEWAKRLRNRPILTGAFLRPTIWNGPLPRMKPQPDHISMMIRHRRAARTNRLERQSWLFELRDAVDTEARFEDILARESDVPFEPVFSGALHREWKDGIMEQLREIQESYQRDTDRSEAKYPPKLLAQIKEARREKVRNKTRERERERSGEVIGVTHRRRRLGYPPHVSYKWSPEELRDRLIARRSISEVGYVGMVKRRLGYKIREEEDQYSDDDKMRLDKAEAAVRRENERRRRNAALRERNGQP